MREVMNAIVENDWDEDYRGGMTQLHYFCEKGLTSSVKRMLDMKSIDVEARRGGRKDGHTCLMTAASNGHLDICRLLIDKGAQVKANCGSDWTPLHYAARNGHIAIVRLLCDRGADIEARTSSRNWRPGSRPLHMAVERGHISIVKVLIEVRNADNNARDEHEETALTTAQNHEKADIVAYLISKGVSSE
jgi:ankyrin repeat protein